MSLIIFDFHGTFTCDPNTAAQDINITNEEILKNIRYPELMKKVFISLLENGHHIAFASFSDEREAEEGKTIAGFDLIKKYVYALFLGEEEKIKGKLLIDSWRENGLTNKYEHQETLIQNCNQHFKTNYTDDDAILIDDDDVIVGYHLNDGKLAININLENSNTKKQDIKDVLEFIVKFANNPNLTEMLFSKFGQLNVTTDNRNFLETRMSNNVIEFIENGTHDKAKRLLPIIFKFSEEVQNDVFDTILQSGSETLKQAAISLANNYENKRAIDYLNSPPNPGKTKNKLPPNMRLLASFFNKCTANDESISDNDKEEIKQPSSPSTIRK